MDVWRRTSPGEVGQLGVRRDVAVRVTVVWLVCYLCNHVSWHSNGRRVAVYNILTQI